MSEEWHYQRNIVTIASPWVTIHGEHWLDHQGKQLEYWRVEKAHSVIVLPIQADMLLLPPPQFRPGVQQATLDFPGGRLPDGMTPIEVAPLLLKKELGLEPSDILDLAALNTVGWIINSSFSNQLLFGVVATIDPIATLAPDIQATRVACRPADLRQLLAQLDCLQCRAVLQDYLFQQLDEKRADAR